MAACSLHQSRATNPTIAMRGSSDPSLRPSDQQPSARGAAAQASGGNSQAGMLCRAAGGSSCCKENCGCVYIQNFSLQIS